MRVKTKVVIQTLCLCLSIRNGTMRLMHHPEPKDISLASVLYALGDPVRLEIVKRLAEKGERTQHINSLRREDLDALFPGLLSAVLQSARISGFCQSPEAEPSR